MMFNFIYHHTFGIIYRCVSTVIDRLVKMKNACGVHVLVVFDGATPPMKADKCIQRRARAKEAAKVQSDEKESLSTRLKAAGRAGASSSTLRNMHILLFQSLRREKIPFLVAPYEADGQLAYLSRIHVVDLVITEDSDLIAHGCAAALFKLDHENYGDLYLRRDLGAQGDGLRLLNFSDGMLAAIFVAAGCDYLPGLSRVGIVTARDAVAAEFANDGRGTGAPLRRLLRRLYEISGRKMSQEERESYERRFMGALLMYRHPVVFSVTGECTFANSPAMDPSIDPELVSHRPYEDLVSGENSEERMERFVGRRYDKRISCLVMEGWFNPRTGLLYDKSITPPEVLKIMENEKRSTFIAKQTLKEFSEGEKPSPQEKKYEQRLEMFLVNESQWPVENHDVRVSREHLPRHLPDQSMSLAKPHVDPGARPWKILDAKNVRHATDVANVEEADINNVAEVDATKVAEAGATDITEAHATDVADVDATNVMQADATNITEADATNVTEADVTDVMKPDGTNIVKADVTDVVKADATNVVGTGATNMEELDANNLAKGGATDVAKTDTTNVDVTVNLSHSSTSISVRFSQTQSQGSGSWVHHQDSSQGSASTSRYGSSPGSTLSPELLPPCSPARCRYDAPSFVVNANVHTQAPEAQERVNLDEHFCQPGASVALPKATGSADSAVLMGDGAEVQVVYNAPRSLADVIQNLNQRQVAAQAAIFANGRVSEGGCVRKRKREGE